MRQTIAARAMSSTRRATIFGLSGQSRLCDARTQTMQTATNFAIVLVTAPDMRTARALGRAALAERLVACANLIPKIESHYRWQGKIESAWEVLMILKTRRSKLAPLEKFILARHPYDTAEFLVLPLKGGARKYLAWLAESVT
jgi:periplasmic divalent cation tolerance protein